MGQVVIGYVVLRIPHWVCSAAHFYLTCKYQTLRFLNTWAEKWYDDSTREPAKAELAKIETARMARAHVNIATGYSRIIYTIRIIFDNLGAQHVLN